MLHAEGRVLSVEFFRIGREDISCWIDAVAVINWVREWVWPFMDDGIHGLLIAPTQKSIDEIVEAFLFKDLHDFSI